MRVLELHESEVVDAVESAAAKVLESKSATLEWSLSNGHELGMVVGDLRPVTPSSARLKIQIDDATLVTLYIGSYATVVECFTSERARLLQVIRCYVDAVIGGRYKEWVKVGRGETNRAIGVLRTHEYSACIRSNTLVPVRWARRRWQRVDYEAYGRRQ